MTVVSGVYAIRNTINGKQYIGSAQNIRTRWNEHRCLLREGRHHSPPLQRAWKKYGEAVFEWVVLEHTASDMTLAREQWWLDQRFAEKGGLEYNIQPNAHSSFGRTYTPEALEAFKRAGKKRSERGLTPKQLAGYERRRGRAWTPAQVAAWERRRGTLTEKAKAGYARRRGRPPTEAQRTANARRSATWQPSDDHRKALMDGVRALYADQERAAARAEKLRSIHAQRSPEEKARIAEAIRAGWARRTPDQKAEYAAHVSARFAGHTVSQEHREKLHGLYKGKPWSAARRAAQEAMKAKWAALATAPTQLALFPPSSPSPASDDD